MVLRVVIQVLPPGPDGENPSLVTIKSQTMAVSSIITQYFSPTFINPISPSLVIPKFFKNSDFRNLNLTVRKYANVWAMLIVKRNAVLKFPAMPKKREGKANTIKNKEVKPTAISKLATTCISNYLFKY